MDPLAQSLWARYRQALGDAQPVPEAGTTAIASPRGGRTWPRRGGMFAPPGME